MKKRKYKQLLASVIACSMVLSGMPATAYAAGNDTAQEVQSEDQTSGTAGSEDSSSAGQQENTGNQTTAGTNESTSTESDSNSQTNSSQDNTSKNNTAQSGTTQNNTASQSAAVDAQSAQDAKAVKATTELEIHKSEGISGSELKQKAVDCFGGNISTTVYYYKEGNDWKLINRFSSDSYKFASGELEIGAGSWKGIVSKGKLTIKNYNNVTFSASNVSGAGVKIDNQDVTTAVKIYDTESKKFTVNDVENYDVTVKIGKTVLEKAADGTYTVPAGLTEDTTVNVVYVAKEGVNIAVTHPANGTITINDQNVESSIKVEKSKNYKVTVTPEDGYAVESILVDNAAVPAANIVYENQTATVTLYSGDVNDATFNITAQTVQCKLDVKDAEVSYHNGMSTDKIAQNIFAAVVGTDNVPEITLKDVTIEYDASSNNWKNLDYNPSGVEEFYCHKFGRTLWDLKDSDTEKIRITYNRTDKYPSMQKTAKITLKDLREETTLSINDGIMMKYQSAEMMDAVIKVLIAQNATVTDKAGNKIETTADDFTYTPSTDEWKAGEQEITVTYNGNEDYLSSSATTTITIKKGDAKVWVNSQNIKYGESFSQIFASDPSDAAPLGMIVGIDGNGESFVGFDVSNIVIKQKARDMAIEYGDDVPDVDYYIYDMNGELADAAIVSGADFPSLSFSIEGQEEGKHLAANATYVINVSGLDNANFDVTYVGGSLTVNPRKINISIDSKKKVEGDADPELTYTVSRATGEAVAQAVEDTAAASAVVEGDELGVTLTREAGETVGLYDIYANVEGLNSNYALAETPDGTDKFEIVKKGTVIDDNKKPSDQNPSGDKTTVKGDNKNNKNTNTAKKADNTKKNQPKTGDNSHVMFYLFMIEAAMVAAFITLIFRRRRRR